MSPEGSKLISILILLCILVWTINLVTRGNNAVQKSHTRAELAADRADHKRDRYERRRQD